MTGTTDTQRAGAILRDNIYCVVATASLDGEPWISPVFFAYDEAWRLYWVSDRAARHSTLIRTNPRVAITIFNSQVAEGAGQGVYCTAHVAELDDPRDIRRGMAVLSARVTEDIFRVTDLAQVTGPSAWRIYQASPLQWSVLGAGITVNGQYVDRRVDIAWPPPESGAD